MIGSLIMRGLAPLSYWLAWVFFKWATSPRWGGLVDPLHQHAAYCGQRIVHYERLLRIRGKKSAIRL